MFLIIGGIRQGKLDVIAWILKSWLEKKRANTALKVLESWSEVIFHLCSPCLVKGANFLPDHSNIWPH